jgi:hypothetical protein
LGLRTSQHCNAMLGAGWYGDSGLTLQRTPLADLLQNARRLSMNYTALSPRRNKSPKQLQAVQMWIHFIAQIWTRGLCETVTENPQTFGVNVTSSLTPFVTENCKVNFHVVLQELIKYISNYLWETSFGSLIIAFILSLDIIQNNITPTTS